MSRFPVFVLLAFFLLPVIMRTAAANDPPEGQKLRIAVFSPENLSGRPAPLKTIRESLISGLASSGVSIVDDATIERFMTRHRIRYTGGIDEFTAAALKTEENIDAVLLSSVEFYDETIPPKIAILSRLVSTGQGAEIRWMDSVAVAGDDSPGLLGIGLINDHAVLREKAVESLIGSLQKHLSGEMAEIKPVAGKYGPKLLYRAPAFPPEGKRPLMAVIPFLDLSGRKYGSRVMLLHLVSELAKNGFYNVIEPGVVRQRLLNLRITMPEGLSLYDANLLLLALKSDLLMNGKIYEYQDFSGSLGVPKIDFMVEVIEKETRKVVWSSTSYNRGDDGVFFFDYGRVNVAGGLSAYMIRSLVQEMSLYGEEIKQRPAVLPYSPGPAE
jgi:hypothetical protein